MSLRHIQLTFEGQLVHSLQTCKQAYASVTPHHAKPTNVRLRRQPPAVVLGSCSSHCSLACSRLPLLNLNILPYNSLFEQIALGHKSVLVELISLQGRSPRTFHAFDYEPKALERNHGRIQKCSTDADDSALYRIVRDQRDKLSKKITGPSVPNASNAWSLYWIMTAARPLEVICETRS